MLTAVRLREVLDYFPDTGVFVWRHRKEARPTWNGRYAGKVAGCHDKDGYVIIGVDGKTYFAHRLAWLHFHGYHPNEIDHLNHTRDDNRICNLVNGNHTTNMRNQTKSNANTTGHMGVKWMENLGKWRARIKVNRRYIHLGVFQDFDDACSARRRAEEEYGFHKNHGAPANDNSPTTEAA